MRTANELNRLDVTGLQPLRALLHLELDTLALFEAAVAAHLDS